MRIGKVLGLAAILAMMLLPAVPIKADEIYIDIDVDGNAYVSVENTNGAFGIWYNGRDILKEWKEAQEAIHNMKLQIYYLSQRSDVDDLQEELEQLQGELSMLIVNLNAVFENIGYDVGYLYEVVGVTGNSTEVVESLQDLNKTVAGYIEGMLARTDEIEVQYTGLLSELNAFANTVDTELGDLEFEAERTAIDIEAIRAEAVEREALWQRAMEEVVTEVEELRAQLVLTYGVYAMFVVFSVIVMIMNAITIKR